MSDLQLLVRFQLHSRTLPAIVNCVVTVVSLTMLQLIVNCGGNIWNIRLCWSKYRNNVVKLSYYEKLPGIVCDFIYEYG